MNEKSVSGCLHDTGATFIPRRDEKLHRVYIKPCLLGCESYSAGKLMKLQWIWKTMKRTVKPRLHDTGMNFHAGMKISLRHKNRGELAPVWLAPAWHFVVVSCKRIQSHKREPRWTRAGMKVAPVSCKHHLSSDSRNLFPLSCGWRFSNQFDISVGWAVPSYTLFVAMPWNGLEWFASESKVMCLF